MTRNDHYSLLLTIEMTLAKNIKLIKINKY